MNEIELRKYARCSLCGLKIGHTHLPLFYRVTVERFGINMNAVRRQAGLEQMLGNVAIAQVMGLGEEMTKPLMDKITLSICEDCSLKPTFVAHLAELQDVLAKPRAVDAIDTSGKHVDKSDFSGGGPTFSGWIQGPCENCGKSSREHRGISMFCSQSDAAGQSNER
jgi:hypothetical protein